jgi:SAM-dependent methyltransferase
MRDWRRPAPEANKLDPGLRRDELTAGIREAKVSQLMVSSSFLRDLRKGLALVRSLVLTRKATAVQPESRSSFDVSRFEVPSCPANLKSVRKARLIEWYWRVHPRFNFFKSVVPNARVLDLGAGSGRLPFWRQYLAPDRSDIHLFGIDLVKPLTASLYDDFRVADLNEGIPFPEEAFDAIIVSHILEHVTGPAKMLAQVAKSLRVGGLAYVEMPSPKTKMLPTAAEYRAAGWPMTISNFHDDATHLDTLDQEALIAMANANGLRCLQAGYVSVPYLDQAMIALGIAWKDAEILLYGYWSATRWAQFAIFERIDGPDGSERVNE